MARGRTIRVFPDGSVWVVKKDSAARASGVFDTKAEALDEAKKIARNQRLSVIIHGRDGRIQRTVRPGDPDAGDCFITTACVRFLGLPDNCYELTTLRAFRDGHLSLTRAGGDLVAEYYERAPALVQRLKRRPDQKELYAVIHQRVRKACALIETGQLDEAAEEYRQAMIWLNSIV